MDLIDGEEFEKTFGEGILHGAVGWTLK